MIGLPNYTPPKTVATKFINQVSENDEGVKKIVLDPSMMANMAGGAEMPHDAMALMQQLMGTANQQTTGPSTSSMQNEAMALMQQMMANQQVKEDPNAGTGMIRKQNELLEQAKKNISSDSMEINIEASCILGLFVNTSKKPDVVERLKTISKVSYDNNLQESIFYYTDVGINFFFNEEDTIVEIEFTEKYREKTTKGLKLGDTIEKAIELYGAPRMKSAKGAIWNRFSIVLHDKSNEIKFIRVKIRE
ncbi:MAG: hypothetical protein U0457_18345 [Candidatus Sericytochromatia bacterium]